MEAKDTVMVRPELQRIWTEAINVEVLAVAPDAQAVSSLLAVAKAQAEISFKAGEEQGKKEQYIVDWVHEGEAVKQAKQEGRREVVEWMEQELRRHKEHKLGGAFEAVLTHYFQHKNISLDKPR